VLLPPDKSKDKDKDKNKDKTKKDRAELAQLRKEVADLKSKATSGQADSSKILKGVEPEDHADVQEFNRAAESLAKVLGADAAETLTVRQRLAEERRKSQTPGLCGLKCALRSARLRNDGRLLKRQPTKRSRCGSPLRKIFG
jgi:hypothetical protein